MLINHKFLIAMTVGSVAMLASAPDVVAIEILQNAQPTIHLPTFTDDDTQSNVAYHPGFQQYYAEDVGFSYGPGYVWDKNGVLLQTKDPEVDFRSVYYNPNTDAIEALSFDACCNTSDPRRGLIEMGLDANGYWTGVNTQIHLAMPDLATTQMAPAYDGARDVFYARSLTNLVQVVRRSDGVQTGALSLDLATPGSANLVRRSIGYDSQFEVLISLDAENSRALVHKLDGTYLGDSQLPVFDYPDQYGFGYTNGQLFVLDTGTDTYRGFRILAPEPSTLALLAFCGLWSLGRRRREQKWSIA